MKEGKQHRPDAGAAPVLSQELLLSVTEGLKLPLLQIARQAEQAQLRDQSNTDTIRATAESALQLLDNYSLAVRLQLDAARLDAEPVSVSSVLYDAGQQLSGLARNYGVELELHIAGRYGTVMAHRQGLQAALVSLGMALIEALPAQQGPRLTLQLATHRSRYGIVAGLYGQTPGLTNMALRHGRRLQRQSRQPLLKLTHTNGAGIFVADALLQAMRLRLRASRHHRLYGLGTVLPPNNQTQLV